MVFSAFSEDFVSPLFPKKGEEVELSIIFSFQPDWVGIKYYTDTGLLFQKDMEENGFYNGAYRYSQRVRVTKDEFPFSYFFGCMVLFIAVIVAQLPSKSNHS